MLCFALIWKALKIRWALNRLKREKRNAYRQRLGLQPLYPLYQIPFRWIGRKIKSTLLNTFCRCCKVRKGGAPSWWSRIWEKGTLPNEIAKGLIGLFVGIIVSKLLLDFLTSQLNFHAETVYWSCIVFDVIFTLSMTFSEGARCLFVLTIPQFFSSKGRTALLAYTLILALSGPGKNTARNMEVLTESLVCGQDMIKNSTRELRELATHPLSALKGAVTIIVKSIEEVLSRMHEELDGILKIIYEIVNTIKQAYAMLKSIVNLCNKKLGSPYDRCLSSFDEATADCKVKLGSAFDWLCSPMDLFRNFCNFAKIVDLLCWLPSLVKEAIINPLKEGFRRFADGFKTFFDVRLNFTYEFDHKVTQDKTLSEVVSNMKNEIMGNVRWLLDYIDWVDLMVSGLLLLILWKAAVYRYKFLNSDEFDNKYITIGMVRMDLRRRRIDKSSIFPLRYRESRIYVQTYSCALIHEERRHMQMALAFVAIASIQILYYPLMDYLLYLFLDLIRRFGSIQFDSKEALGVAFSVEGEGFLAAMYRSILNGLSPAGGGLLPSFDTSKCLPMPQTPNYYEYAWIIFLVLLCFVLASLEPYGLRLRHIVCGWIYEERIVPRETWLYIHILSRRDNFLDYAKGQLRAKIKGDRSVYQVSIMDKLYHWMPCCKRWFRSHKKKCFLCGQPGQLEDFEYFVECPNCRTVYCKECFNDMGQRCLACMKRINYEEMSEFSEELGSSSGEDTENDGDLIEKCCNRLCNCCRKKQGRLKSKSVSKQRRENEKRFKTVKYTVLNEAKSVGESSKHSAWLSKKFGGFSSKSFGNFTNISKQLKSPSKDRKELTKLLNSRAKSPSTKIRKGRNKSKSPKRKKMRKFSKDKRSTTRSKPNKAKSKSSSKTKRNTKREKELPKSSATPEKSLQKTPKSNIKHQLTKKQKGSDESKRKSKKAKADLKNKSHNYQNKAAKLRNNEKNTNKKSQKKRSKSTSKLHSQNKVPEQEKNISHIYQSKAEKSLTPRNNETKSKKKRSRSTLKNSKLSQKTKGRRQDKEQGKNEEEEECKNCWWLRDPKAMKRETFRRPPNNIAPSLRQRVEDLNKFYDRKPYPPNCNL